MEYSVSARYDADDLRKLQALARVEHTTVGHQIRKGIRAYLESRKDEVVDALSIVTEEQVRMLENLFRKE